MRAVWASFALAYFLIALPVGAEGQMRPLDPLDWEALDSGQKFSVRLGGEMYTGKRASLAGTEGRLYEAGAYRAIFTLDRVTIEISGTVVRMFDDRRRIEEPLPGTAGFQEELRVDAGDQRVATVIRLTDGEGSWDAAVRFGARLPTTDDEVGLERDQTDFFATVSARYRRGPFRLSGDAGYWIHGTRDLENEQIDPVLLAASLAYDLRWIRPELQFVAQLDTRPTADRRGVEEMAEIRLGLRRGEARWVRLGLVHGWTAVSPDFGVTLEFGLRR